MARGRNTDSNTDQPTPDATEVEPDPTATEPAATAAPATSPVAEKPKAEKLTDEQIASALEPFLAVVSEVIETRNTATGELAEDQFAKGNAAYNALDGVAVKTAAKRKVNDLMKDAMNASDIILARAYMELHENLKATGKAKSTSTRTPKEPVNPTKAFVERCASLQLATTLVADEAPEGVDADWVDKVNEALGNVDRDAVTAYRTWLLSDAEDKGDAPESATPLIVAAVKLSLGRSAKPGKAVRKAGSNGSTATYDGPRRDIGKHIAEAFAGVESGTFLKVGTIRNFESAEYGTDHPSAGAISARLFPKTGKCTVEGITPDTDSDGNKGARKN